MNKLTEFFKAVKPTPAEIAAKEQIQQAKNQGNEHAISGYTLGVGTHAKKLEEAAIQQGLCLSFNDRLTRALGAAFNTSES